MPYDCSTQARLWTFSEQKLAELRAAGAEAACKKLQSAEAGSSEIRPLEPHEEILLRSWYEAKLQEVCREENKQESARFTDRVMSSALM